MAEFILEIGTEEMPARFVPRLASELKESFVKLLDEAMVHHNGVSTYATPRRITAHVVSIAETQRREEETVTGPPARIAFDAEGNLTKAGGGFAKTQGVDTKALFKIDTGKGEYLAAKKTVGGRKTLDVLPSLCLEALNSLTFPKKMSWGDFNFTFGRPIRWLLALFDETIVEFSVENMASGRETRGHRVMGAGPFAIQSAKDYFDVIKQDCNVIIDPQDRQEAIVRCGNKLAHKLGGKIVWDDSLLEEVANLIEFPNPLIGDIDRLYLELPREVLLTSMQSHQKSFGVEDSQGNLLPYFLTTLNLEPTNIALVKKGWERVLKARLEDARFFWEADCKVDFQTWLDKLENVVFLGPLGSVGDKSRRMEKLCGKLAEVLDQSKSILPGEIEKYRAAGRLAKADLVSEMVIEFDSLQGKMGGIYAERSGKGEIVSKGIYEHYLPAGPDTSVPPSLSGALVSIADKMDTLVGCFGLGKSPKGANDPYALRRCAIGIARIIMDHNLDIDLEAFLKISQAAYGKNIKWKVTPDESVNNLVSFFEQRLRAFFIGQGFDSRAVNAALGAGFNDICTLKARLEALGVFTQEDDFEQAVLTFKRAANIIRKQGDEAGQTLTGFYDPELFEDEHESNFGNKLDEILPHFDELWQAADFSGLMGLLRELRPSVDSFFENVMVMCDDVDIRLNRLNLLKALVNKLGRLADFNALQV
ncbi:glycine--tRNA ligase subunit beta [Pseudodesulfovibrio piezophilus]|uniref:Glycine--tRNA ligase beta subunit n=1 Tax=Pseudodesulfovibrio piezophilus (strain DSM 21447 / JCM 15486 / C1TLV30) TaxID=1322246 RepID=M1WJD5_PSEP2|nr:glycine--tRNA ligase subunit beta [Pseudodesulfovibrio piezophilus]CCH47706.1 Glycyl-tRNA synthetase beta subunit [Pseudodesulfovibrio piezophilus C1TLV30]